MCPFPSSCTVLVNHVARRTDRADLRTARGRHVGASTVRSASSSSLTSTTCRTSPTIPHVTGGVSLQNISWAFTHAYEGYWSPVTWLSYMADTSLFGVRSGAYHLTNVAIHAATACLLFLVLFRMTRHPWRSAVVAALFAVHPLHVESVAWVAERKDVLSGFFWFLTIWTYVRYVERPVWTRYACVIVSFGLWPDGEADDRDASARLAAARRVAARARRRDRRGTWKDRSPGRESPGTASTPPRRGRTAGCRCHVVRSSWEKVPLLALSVAMSLHHARHTKRTSGRCRRSMPSPSGREWQTPWCLRRSTW